MLNMSLKQIALCLLVVVATTSALKCRVCTTGKKHDDKACSKLEGDNFLVDCNKHYNTTNVFKYCRIQSQEVEDYHVLHRDCAYEGKKGCVERAGTKGIKLTYCECEGDDCNTAASVFTSPLVMLVTMVTALVLCH